MSRVKIAIAFAIAASTLAAASNAASAAEFRAFNKAGTEIKGAVAGELTGIAEQRMTIGTSLVLTCTELKAKAKETVPSTSVSGAPVYSGCKSKVSGVTSSATITNEGCTLSLFVVGTASVNCAKGDSIVIAIGKICTIKIGSQEGLEKVTYSPLGSKASAIIGKGDITRITQENSCGVTGEVVYLNESSVKAEEGVTMEIK
jgi:hypothetical protein